MIDKIDRLFFPDYQRNWDDQIFRSRILQYLNVDTTVLDIGAGAGIVSEMNFRGLVQKSCGIDLDPRVESNPMLDEGVISKAEAIPYPDKSFDVIFSNNVMEHLTEPLRVFEECNRVLKPGGFFLFKTPNKTHYMPTIARLTPHWFHQYFNRLRGRAEIDTFPTFYRVNSAKQVRRLANSSGFKILSIDRIEGRPEYMRLTLPTYLLGTMYERIVNSMESLAMFRILLIAELRKPLDS